MFNKHFQPRFQHGQSMQLVVALLVAPIALIWLSACATSASTPTSTPLPLAKELVFYDWVDDMPQSVLDEFTKEYGVQIIYDTYDSPEEAVENIRNGKAFDVAIVDPDLIPALMADNLLAEIDYRNVPNFRNTSANFRDLVFDPKNRHSVPHNFGTSGLIVRSDLVDRPITRWADLWDKRFAGKIALRDQPTEIIGLTLLSLGYAINSENPAELQVVQDRLLALRPSVFFVETETEKAVAKLCGGDAVILFGWSQDLTNAQAVNSQVSFVVPEDSVTFWYDNYTISSHSHNQYTAEVFIDFLLRPEISAQMVNETQIATANETAIPLVNLELRNNPALFPPQMTLAKAKPWLPLSLQGQKLYQDIWTKFKSTGE